MALNLSVDIVLGYLIDIFKFIFKFISKLITGLSVDFGKALLLIFSFLMVYFLYFRMYETGKIKKWLFVLISTLIFWFMLIFSMGAN